MIRVEIPGLKLVSEANARGRWYAGANRAAQQRAVVAAFLRPHRPVPVPAVVRIVRIAPCRLDDDNAARAAKAVRDEVARWFGVDDRDPRITWHVGQERRGVKEYGVRILVRRWAPELVGARVREVGAETHAEMTLRAPELSALARALEGLAAGRGTNITVAVGEVRLSLHRAGGAAG